jgi:hypothetical protein
MYLKISEIEFFLNKNLVNKNYLIKLFELFE